MVSLDGEKIMAMIWGRRMGQDTIARRNNRAPGMELEVMVDIM